jgi:UDP-N-acetylglucosamine--N-acetylmuramyl-(pentapeptide) pyrophosphoryl-undecaprenol N-acetylglucosamine transferase
MKANLTILFAGGGTAGHFLPALATEEALRKVISTKRKSGLVTSYLATKSGAEVAILREKGLSFHFVPKTDLPRKFGFGVITFIPRLLLALAKTLPLVSRADIVVGFGGYVALPAYLSAAILHKPLIVHEANALPGLANKVGRRFAHRALANFPISGWNPVDAIGLPIRETIWRIGALTAQERTREQLSARAKFSLDPKKKTLFIFGGSLGAARLNQVVSESLDQLSARGVQILHGTGVGKAISISRPDYHPFSYIAEMDQAYLAADLLLCRGGAGTCAEIMATGIPAVLVPLGIGNGEQMLNAQQLVQSGNVRVISNNELTPDLLLEAVDALSDSPTRVAQPEFSPAQKLAGIILETVDKNAQGGT